MARFRRKAKRSRSSGFKRGGGRRRSSSGGGSGMKTLLMHAGWGFARPKVNQLARQYLPVGGVSDSVLLLGVAWGAKKFVRNSTVNAIADAAMRTEAFFIGTELANGGFGGLLGGSSTATSGTTVYM